MGHTAVVLGASGYSGGELLRLLSVHPSIEVVAVAGQRSAGEALSTVQPHLLGGADLTLLTTDAALDLGADIVFSCLPSGSLPVSDAPFVVDLADDHRADDDWVYGLTEFARDRLPSPRVANPGCYPTATLLALVPFARAGVIAGPVIVDALSGVSGAGRKGTDDLAFATLDGDAHAYGSTTHRHVPEMERGLATFGGTETTVSFTPHLVPLTRGLLVTARFPLAADLDDADALAILQDAYSGEAFVHPTTEWPSVKPTAGSNSCVVSARVDARNGLLIASAAIDNLGKGAAGQALQNANLCLGIEEGTGLSRVGVWP